MPRTTCTVRLAKAPPTLRNPQHHRDSALYRRGDRARDRMAVGSNAPASLAYQVGPESAYKCRSRICCLTTSKQTPINQSTDTDLFNCVAIQWAQAAAVPCRSDAQLPSKLRVPVPFVRCPASRLEQ